MLKWSLLLAAVVVHSAYALPQAQAEPSAAATSTSQDDSALVASVSSAVTPASLKPYIPPMSTDEIKEWSALGDSFTAGIGSNGLADYQDDSNSCSRYNQAYPMQMNANTRWPGDPKGRKLNFGACRGNKMSEVTSNQLSDSATVDYNNIGKPQLAYVTIAGNDLGFSTAINSCVIRAWGWPWIADCDKVLTGIEDNIQDQAFQGKLDETLLAIVVKGRANGGANPPESFQLYVNGYVPFWNEIDTGCDSISWEWWRATHDHFLTSQLRKRINGIVRDVNFQIKQSASRLANQGVFYVDGFQDSYTGHQFCDPAADTNLAKPITSNTWFWARDSPWNAGEGPSSSPSTSGDHKSLPQAILNALIPDQSQRATVTSAQQPPSNYNNAFTSQDSFETALEALSNSSDPDVAALPEQWRRIFHPKGTAHGHHSEVSLNAVLGNRQAAPPAPAAATTSPPSPAPAPTASDICGDWYKSVLDYFEIRGKNFDPTKFGIDGSGLEKQTKGCGALTKWSFTYTPNDPRFAWFAHGQLPVGTKGCVGRAVVSAGGAAPDGCTGPG